MQPKFNFFLLGSILRVSYVVRWYIFDIGTILISIKFNEFFSLRDFGSTYSTVVA
jgi:hypothetical protein